MKLLLSLLLLVGLLLVSTSAAACDPRYFNPRTCEPYYVPMNQGGGCGYGCVQPLRRDPNPYAFYDPYNPYRNGTANYGRGCGRGCGRGYGRGYVGGAIVGHNHGNGCGHARQSRYINWGVSGSISTRGRNGGSRIGGHINGGSVQHR
jgi:hypothetical protein